MKFVYLLLFLFSATSASAALHEGLDYQLEAGGQTYPLGGLLKAQAGYGLSLWAGAHEGNDSQFWKYGYIRPSAEFQTGGIVNRGILSLEVYPISIFGVSGGVGMSQRGTKRLEDFDCQAIQCDDQLTYGFLQTRLILGYEKVALILNGKYEKFDSKVLAKPFYEEMSYLVGNPGRDDLKTLSAILLYQQDETWSGGFLGIYQSFLGSRNNSSSNFAIVNYTQDAWRGTVGLGQYTSSLQRNDYAVILSLKYTGAKSIGLF